MTKTKEELKEAFKSGAAPSEQDFSDLIDAISESVSLVATAKVDGLMSKEDAAKLSKLTDNASIPDLKKDSNLETVIAAFNKLNAMLKKAGITK